MKRIAIITFQYYSLLTWFNIAFTAAIQLFFAFGGVYLSRATFLVSKSLGFIGAILAHYYMDKNHYLYFRNAGFAMRWIFLRALMLDTAISLTITFTCLN